MERPELTTTFDRRIVVNHPALGHAFSFTVDDNDVRFLGVDVTFGLRIGEPERAVWEARSSRLAREHAVRLGWINTRLGPGGRITPR